jgi:hypothetical protein
LNQELATLAGISTRQAATILKKYDYKIERAADAIFSGAVKVDQDQLTVGIEKLFQKYKGAWIY